MAFDRALTHRHPHDRRRPYYGNDSRNFDWSCRHGGSCTYCSSNRAFSSLRRSPIVEKEFMNLLDKRLH